MADIDLSGSLYGAVATQSLNVMQGCCLEDDITRSAYVSPIDSGGVLSMIKAFPCVIVCRVLAARFADAGG